ncbi:MAG: molybdopterin-guanine dinucleotide biosynthesis protein B [Candidatus Abyssobacteria bacterium SURF_5]|uniref:Molybdopterin-guanine dinucleotide biosynthesis protein B n=1 Tax=Abyssobacteria bacterium (strain SURF_5) TaxID=2093360 RepID=A0A3A4PD25_ABYX5|nr:MAG: molybdopterin-guanine dinucleotide biosynthesis protein B [Candidatus Abyssubacteria bacterium SURF_5]
MVPVVSIVGKSDSGKTTLIEKIIPILKRRGYRVGTVKHDVHGFEMDREGKDTYRHFHSGADAVLISSPTKLALIRRAEREIPLDELVKRYYSDLDIVITEGFKRVNMPKIEVFRSVIHDQPLCTSADNRIAIASDTPLEVDCPWFDIDDAEAIADFIEQHLLKRGSGVSS